MTPTAVKDAEVPPIDSDEPLIPNSDNDNETHTFFAESSLFGVPEPPSHDITWKGIISHLGPAFLVSIGYLDPGNWATDIEGGSRFGYSLLWVLILSNLMALLLQVLAARMGIVTKSHLAKLCREEYPRGVNFALWILAELAIIATDLTEVLGTAIGLNLVFKIPLMPGVVLTGLDTFLLLAAQNSSMKKLERLIFAFLAIISMCFIVELFISKPSVPGILKGSFVPSMNLESLYVSLGIIGATVMPHNFYLHSALVIPRVPNREPATLAKECKYTLIDAAIALNAAMFINMAILIVAASSFYSKGIEVKTLQKAYHLLQATGVTVFSVNLAPLLFGIALIASGQSSTLCGTLAGQYVMDGFLNIKFSPIIRRVVTRLVAIVPAIIVIFILGDAGTYRLLIAAQVVLSMQLPFAIVPLIRFTDSPHRMQGFENKTWVSFASWLAAALTVALNISFVIHLVVQGLNSPRVWIKWITGALCLPLFIVLLAFLIWIAARKETVAIGGYRVEDEGAFEIGEVDSLGSPVVDTPPPVERKQGDAETPGSPFALDNGLYGQQEAQPDFVPDEELEF